MGIADRPPTVLDLFTISKANGGIPVNFAEYDVPDEQWEGTAEEPGGPGPNDLPTAFAVATTDVETIRSLMAWVDAISAGTDWLGKLASLGTAPPVLPVRGCSSCGEDHDAVMFEAIPGSIYWTHSGRCPITGARLYMKGATGETAGMLTDA